jgi:sporulation protein YlmC with PRC-barrel domain
MKERVRSASSAFFHWVAKMTLDELSSKRGGAMARYRMQGNELQNDSYRKIAELRGNEILDANWQKVGEVRGDEIVDVNWRKVAEVRGEEIVDESFRPIGRLSDVRAAIDDAHGGATLAGLWYFFIR